MLTMLLLACKDPSTATDSADSGGDTDSADTDTDVPAEEVLWTKYRIDTSSTLRGVYSSGQGVYVIGSRGQAWVGSATTAWSAVTLPAELAGVDLNGLWGSGAGETLQLAIAADDGWVATYSAATWTMWSLGTEDNIAVDGTALTNLFVAGDNGIQRFDGATWTLESTPTVAMYSVCAFETAAYAAGAEGTVLRRGDGGVWAASDTGKVANFFAINGVSAGDVWAVGDQGVIMHWNGTAWSQSDNDRTETLNALFVGAADGVIAVGNGGVTLTYNGDRWRERASDTFQNLYAVHGVSAANAWTVGNGGLAMQYINP